MRWTNGFAFAYDDKNLQRINSNENGLKNVQVEQLLLFFGGLQLFKGTIFCLLCASVCACVRTLYFDWLHQFGCICV